MDAGSLPTERQTSITELAFRHLRKDLLRGAFSAGSKLKLDVLQAQYGFSSSPLREALSRLAQEGFVRADERRGFRVAALTQDDLADITRMRLMLDLEAFARSIEAGDDEWEAQVVAAFHRLDKVESKLSDGPALLDDEWGDLHRAFHMALLQACPSERLTSWSASLFDQAERYRRASARHRKNSRRKSTEHRRLMDAALKRDTVTACALLAEHIRSTQRYFEPALPVPAF